MDGYAPAFVAHNVPLLLVSGLGQMPHDAESTPKNGIQISSDIDAVESEDAIALLTHFRECDASNLAWNSREYAGRNRFRVKIIGRDYTLPPRSAPLPASIQPISPTTKIVIHSPLSPLSLESSLFPDGLVDSKWVEKHQELVPSAFVSFYAFTSEPDLSTLRDNQLKTDINNMRHTLSRSGYRTRLIVALLSEKSILQSPDVEERLANIRRATGLDAKTSLYFLPPQSSAVELQAFVETITSNIYPLCIEYYRDLSKHSRRKRNRGVVPPPTYPPTLGTSRTLSAQGWNVRYDFKLGVFAEFRQEMDAALRSYEGGYEALLGSDVLEAIASWSPRWNESRLLSDVFAIRMVRCLLWNGKYTAAVRRWHSHKERTKDFVDRRGKGSATYSWAAWEARWTTVMAEMIKMVSIPEFAGSTIYLPAEKSISIGERMKPWEYLHHPGYWFHASSRHHITGRNLLLSIPEEDRKTIGSSPNSNVTNKLHTYDTYLCPGPHEESPLSGHQAVDHSALVLDIWGRAATEYEQRKQIRLSHELQLYSARESMKREDWNNAIKTLRPLWQNMSYRKEGWWNIVEEVSWAFRNAAIHAGDAAAVLAVDWELMNESFTHHPDWNYDLSKSLLSMKDLTVKTKILLQQKYIHSFLTATYTFEYSEGRAGELCLSQFAVMSTALSSSCPVTISEIKITFEGSMKPITLKNSAYQEGLSIDPSLISLERVVLSEALDDNRPKLVGNAFLVFRPGHTRVFEFVSRLREAGEARAVSAIFSMCTDLFELQYTHNVFETNTPNVWWGEGSVKKRLVRESASSITILPKPPKLQLRFVRRESQYYTTEQITLPLQVINEEEVNSVVKLNVQLLGDGVPPIAVKIDSGEESETHRINLSGISLGNIASGKSTKVIIMIPPLEYPIDCELSIKAVYHLISDLETPIYTTLTSRLEVINPFEANYDFSPRIHPDPWPSIFTHEEGEVLDTDQNEIRARGLSQRWCLTARYFSFATEELIVEDVDAEVLGTNGAIQCYINKLTELPKEGRRLGPRTQEEAVFETSTRKLSLDDRGSATLDISLVIKWRRDAPDSPSNRMVVPVPRFLVSSSEPRVLAVVSYSVTIPIMIHFNITIENPSTHFLTFGLSMETSDKFAFSGIKQSTLQLVPMSRKTVRFRILPNIRGEWVGPIQCVVRDRYFQKVLRIVPTEGMRGDKEGIMVWVPPEK